jgi:uncharacterized protein
MTEIVFDSKAEDFLKVVVPLLEWREAENCLMLGLCMQLAKWKGAEPPLLIRVVNDRGRTVSAALRTPPYNLITTFSTHEDLLTLGQALLAKEIQIPGIIGPEEEAGQFAGIWTTLTGRQTNLVMDQLIYKLEKEPSVPDEIGGAMEKASAKDAPTIAAWIKNFTAEALPHELPHTRDFKVLAESEIAEGNLYLWKDKGKAMGMAGLGWPTANGIRIRMVYTPEEYRDKGVASNLVAALSRQVVAGGTRNCYLFTDFKNTISNRLYEHLGYKLVGPFQNFMFV